MSPARRRSRSRLPSRTFNVDLDGIKSAGVRETHPHRFALEDGGDKAAAGGDGLGDIGTGRNGLEREGAEAL